MNHAPKYRRRRRVAVALLLTLAAIGFHYTGGAEADLPTHISPVTKHEWTNR